MISSPVRRVRAGGGRWRRAGRACRADVTRRRVDDPLRSPHGGCRRPGGAQRPGIGPPSGGRAPRRAGAARQRALGHGRGPGRRRGIGVRSTRCPSFRPTRREDTEPTPGRSSTTAASDPRPGRAVPPVRGTDTRRGRPPPANGHRHRLPHRHPHRRRRWHPRRSRHRHPSWSSRTTLNLTGRSPLIGPEFVDMADAYDPRLRALALATPEPAASVLAARPASTPSCPVPSSRRPPRSACSARPAPTSWGCRWPSRPIAAPAGRSRGPRAGLDHQSGRGGRFHASTSRTSPTSELPPCPPWPPLCATS